MLSALWKFCANQAISETSTATKAANMTRSIDCMSKPRLPIRECVDLDWLGLRGDESETLGMPVCMSIHAPGAGDTFQVGHW